MINDALIEGTRLGLPAVKTYLESRMKPTQHPLLGLSQKLMETNSMRTSLAIEGEYGYIEASIWGAESEFKDKLFKKQGAEITTRFETVDLP